VSGPCTSRHVDSSGGTRGLESRRSPRILADDVQALIGHCDELLVYEHAVLMGRFRGEVSDGLRGRQQPTRRGVDRQHCHHAVEVVGYQHEAIRGVHAKVARRATHRRHRVDERQRTARVHEEGLNGTNILVCGVYEAIVGGESEPAWCESRRRRVQELDGAIAEVVPARDHGEVVGAHVEADWRRRGRRGRGGY